MKLGKDIQSNSTSNFTVKSLQYFKDNGSLLQARSQYLSVTEV